MISHALVNEGYLAASVDAETPVPWWSFTKSVLAAATLALVRDGRLDLDERLDGQPFTTRQLLRHQAGLPDYGSVREYHEAVNARENAWPAEEMLARAGANRLIFGPAQGWSYSNIGYWRIRRLLESITRLSLGEALERLVLLPLGLTRPRLVTTKADLAGVRMGTATEYDPRWVYHGLLVGPLEDAALLLDRLMKGDLLPPELLQQMLDRHQLTLDEPDGLWLDPGYGLGLMIGAPKGGSRLIGHSGAGPGSVVAVYHSQAVPRVTCAAFAEDAQLSDIEQAVVGLMKGEPSSRGGRL